MQFGTDIIVNIINHHYYVYKLSAQDLTYSLQRSLCLRHDP